MSRGKKAPSNCRGTTAGHPALSPEKVIVANFQELKQYAGIEAYRRRLSTLKRNGAGYVALCPFHADSNPSLSVFQKENEWFFKCHGCDKGGDLIGFVELTEAFRFWTR
jgi:DNA primase